MPTLPPWASLRVTTTMKMQSAFRFWAPAVLLGAASLTPILPSAVAQAGQAATQPLLEKAHGLEAQGRLDMAAQVWQQVLLADPNNTEALGGLARSAKASGNQALAAMYLERLRAINPNDPGIARAESTETQRDHRAELQEAGKLAQQGQYAQAMNEYRKIYGGTPPPGDVALAYYETEAATEEGRPHAIAGLRAMMAQVPRDARYQIALGKILTYNPRTRAEGRKLLEAHPESPEAQEALRQSLLWDAANPATARDIRAYLSRHQDAQLATSFRAQPRRGGGRPLTPLQRAQTLQNASRTAADRAAYKDLNAKQLAAAEERFKAILANNPDEPNALAGMGYIRMQQANFGGAISFLVQAKQDGSKDPGLDAALNTSRFWYTMGEGAIALNENNLPAAEKNYHAALMMRPDSTEAMEGLGGTLLKAQQPGPAIPYFAAYAKLKPQAAHAWRGLFLAQYGSGDAAHALETERMIPAAPRAELMKDPLYLRSLAMAYTSVGRDADSQRVLKMALQLPFPSDLRGMEVETQLQYAGLLQQANRLDQAAGLYRQILAKDPNNTSAWQALVQVEHQQDHNAEALETIESMPPASYSRAMRVPGFESTVASIYQAEKRYDVAQDILEKAIAQQASTGQKVSVAVQIQLAGIYLQRNNSQQAFPMYQRILSENPNNTDAWKGLLAALHDAGKDGDALAEVRQIPAPTRALLENDVAYLQTVGAIYNGLGQTREGSIFLRRVQQHFASQHVAAPADVDIQNAWLLYNGMDDAGLFRQLMVIGDRTDLSDAQRLTVQTIWTNWAVRRANQAAAAGNNRRALAILNATARSFPENPAVIKALAAGYARAGMAKEAVAIWKSQDLNAAPAADYKAAVGAALAAQDMKDAETWLRFGLEQYPKDSQMLSLAAKFEEARGDTNRAADYYRASLDAMPASDPGAELAAELSHPSPDAGRLPSNAQPQDLAGLLQPGINDASGRMAPPRAAPYLPGYGNYMGNAPVSAPGQGFEYDMQQPPVYTPSPAPVVPSYMTAPQSAVPGSGPGSAPAAPIDRSRPRLQDYVPQASATEPVPMDGIGIRRVEFSSNGGDGNVMVAPAVYGQEQVARLSEEVQVRPVFRAAMYILPQQGQQTGAPAQAPAAGTVHITATPTGASAPAQSSLGQAGTGQAGTGQAGTAVKPMGEVYGPYVPYQAPAPVPVQLGNSNTATPAKQPEATDVLPTARYVPNAHSRKAAQQHPSVTAAEAAAARRRQSSPLAPAGTPDVTAPLTGESHPPDEDYTTVQAEPAQYTGKQNNPAIQPKNQINQNQIPANQVPQPAPAATPGVVYQAPASRTQTAQPQSAQPYNGYPVQSGVPSGPETYGQQYPQPNTGAQTAAPAAAYGRRRTRQTAKAAAQAAQAPAAVQPQSQALSYPGVGQPLTYQPYPLIGPAYPLGEAPSDYDLVDQRLPPLRGPYYTGNLRAPEPPLTERQQAERDLETLEGAYSGWLGGTGSARYRSGTVGLDRLTDFETTFEASATVGNNVRLTVVPKAVFLNSGQLSTSTSLNPNPILGTLVGNAAVDPSNQFANGVGGEFQVATKNFAAAIGYTPYEFLVRNYTGRLLFQPVRHVTFYGDRSPVVETQLSYAGLRDPGSATPVFSGNIWGGVISTGGGVRFDGGGERAGFYLSADGADLTGVHVLENYKFEGTMGAYFLAHTWPGYGRLNIGASLFGMHYNYNERGLTYGLGGYFSPEAYVLASVPVTFTGRYGKNFHYVVAGALGVQSFQEDNQIYFPLDRGLQTSVVCTNVQLATQSCGQMPTNSNTGGNYSINAEGSYRVAEHWYAGGFLSANNTNNYNTVTGGFFVRYLFRPQVGNDDYPTGLFPVEGFRPLRVP